ncbi:MAG TPA: hypothetical protein HA366_03305 [Candidatus Methanomethylophilaceae archaeon]|nr:hypothetical protein [Candidatus Methanomethylophilaceae archaeon]HIJ00545.1 hypothetical protein [Candidatus Methanomethylophilaceae archaeon]
MNKKIMIGLTLTVLLGALLIGTAVTVDWGAGDEIHAIPFNPPEGEISDTLNQVLFDEYGAVVMVMAVLMFSAIIGGVFLAKEDWE